MYVPHFLYPFICRWTFRLLPFLVYYKQCCSELWGCKTWPFKRAFLLLSVARACFADTEQAVAPLPPQYSCLENPADGGAWWAAVYGVTQSRTRLKRLGSGSGSFADKPFTALTFLQLAPDPGWRSFSSQSG